MPTTDSLPDIGVLGRYTYLATEVVFGVIAAVLLYRARALRRAAVTIAAIYPIAYVWDWYTLHVGVFSIELRTGREFLGIPIEEHCFAIVVPAFVLGVHETVHSSDADAPADGHSGRTASGVGARLRTLRWRLASALDDRLPGSVARRLPGVAGAAERRPPSLDAVGWRPGAD